MLYHLWKSCSYCVYLRSVHDYRYNFRAIPSFLFRFRSLFHQCFSFLLFSSSFLFFLILFFFWFLYPALSWIIDCFLITAFPFCFWLGFLPMFWFPFYFLLASILTDDPSSVFCFIVFWFLSQAHNLISSFLSCFNQFENNRMLAFRVSISLRSCHVLMI